MTIAFYKILIYMKLHSFSWIYTKIIDFLLRIELHDILTFRTFKVKYCTCICLI
jgi:hypothetical protein